MLIEMLDDGMLNYKTEKKFIDWLRVKLIDIAYGEEDIEKFEVREVIE